MLSLFSALSCRVGTLQISIIVIIWVGVVSVCFFCREGRLKIDLVHDDVQKELLKEVETLEGVQALLQRTLEEATEQVRYCGFLLFFLLHPDSGQTFCSDISNAE